MQDVGNNIRSDELNEYATSRADLVIRREKCNEEEMSCCFVSLNDDVPDVTNDIPCIDGVCGLVTELKLSDESNHPICEYFRNMSAVGASVAIEELAGDRLVNHVKVYRIVARVNGLQHSKLLNWRLIL